MSTPATFADPVFSELGRCLVAYQSIEHFLKLLLPHMSPNDAAAEAKANANINWRELLDSKETLGSLMKLLAQRVSSSDPSRFSVALSELVAERNEIVHHFLDQPFVRLESLAQFNAAMQFLQSRRASAAAFLEPLQTLAQVFASEVEAMRVPNAR